MKCEYHFDINNQIIIETFSGIFNLDEYINHKKEQHKQPDYNSNFRIIADFRNISVSEPHKETIEKIVQFFNETIDKKTKRKTAIITKTPLQVVNSVFFSKYATELNLNIKIFSSMEAALTWMKEG